MGAPDRHHCHHCISCHQLPFAMQSAMEPDSTSQNDATLEMLWRQEWERDQGLLPPNPPNRSNSHSKSSQSRPSTPCTSSSTNTPILSERLESSDETVLIIIGPEGTEIGAAELCRIKVDIHRNIPGRSTDSDLQLDIFIPGDIVVERRAGEGSEPIIEGVEIKVIIQTDEVEEHCTDATVNNDTSEGISLGPIRNRSHSPRCMMSRHSRDERPYRNRSREQGVSPPHYNEHIPYPTYYNHFPPRPIMMTPFLPIYGQVPLVNNTYSPMLGPSQPDFSPIFMHPYINHMYMY